LKLSALEGVFEMSGFFHNVLYALIFNLHLISINTFRSLDRDFDFYAVLEAGRVDFAGSDRNHRTTPLLFFFKASGAGGFERFRAAFDDLR